MSASQSPLRSARTWLGHHRRDLRWSVGLLGAPRGVQLFQWRAVRLARRTGDAFSITSVTRPADMKVLLELARGRRHVVELGTATGWTAISLALADPARRVVTFDPFERPEPDRYLALVPPSVRQRIELVIAPGSAGPRHDGPVDFLYIDSSHQRDETLAEVEAWRPHLVDGALVVFDDYGNPQYPGVRQAVDALGLAGEHLGELFIHRHG